MSIAFPRPAFLGLVTAIVLAGAGRSYGGDAPAPSVAAPRSSPELIVPAPPDDGSKPNCATPRKYVDLLSRHRYADIGALYAPDAVHFGPDGVTRRGREAIAAFYVTALPKAGSPAVYATAYLQDGLDCVVELAGGADRPGAPIALGAIDHFTVDEHGQIKRFIMFISPPASMPRGAPTNGLAGSRN